jgi:[protein-PII] uridylyltransferase
MEIDVQKAAPRAVRTPAPTGAGEGGPVESFRRVLKIETKRLRIRHRLGATGSEIAGGRSALVDAVVRRAVEHVAADLDPAALSGERDRLAVVALGGYGRRELAPFSDVDLLFLHGDRSSRSVSTLVERVLALLWDVGFTVGHSFRTVGECVSMARDDLHSRTALAEARLLTGSEALFQRLLDHVNGPAFGRAGATDAFLASLRLELGERYARFGHAVCLQEPQVKESAGGLRDLHTILWVGHARYGCRGLEALREHRRMSDAEYAVARRSHEFLLRVRNEAHFATGRKTDLLTLDLQPALAESLGYRPRRGRQASEVFMREYYQRASELHRLCRAFILRASPAPARRFPAVLLRRRPRGTFEVRDGKLHPRASSESLGSAPRLMEAFALLQNEDLEMSEELKLDVRGSLDLVDRAYRSSRDAGRAFLRLLERKGRVAATLRCMHETGFLGRFLPEFGRVTFLVQHDFFHRYTVDEHTLKAIEALDQVAATADPALARLRRVLDGVEDVIPLYLGILLHDVGKGHGGGHVGRGVRIGERLCARLGVPAATAEHALFLVAAHLEMSKLSQQRDLSEPGLIESFARRVQTVERLDTLLLLTYADHCGVGPGIWNEWKAMLLWDLYEKTRAHLAAGGPRERRVPAWRKASLRLQAEFPPSEVERHFALMPERYLRTTDGLDMVRHLRLVQSLGDATLVASWSTPPEEHFTELTVATRDRVGLFASLAGTLTASALDILSVDLFTRDDGLVLDVFKVRGLGDHGAVPAERWPRVEQALRRALDGGIDVAAAVEKARTAPRRRGRRPPARPVVRFDSESSATHTVIEVRADDEPGLAFRIASALSGCGLGIGFAKIATEKSHALDVFYVAGPGGKLPPEETARVEAALLAALDPGERALVKEEG